MCQASDALRATAAGVGPVASVVAAQRPGRRAPRSVVADERLILLGTAGGSNPKSTRAGFANAIVVGDDAYILDCGEGSNSQAWKAGIVTNSHRRREGGSTVRTICFTHLHSDHVIDYANFLLGFWPSHAIDVYGPGESGLPITGYPPERVVPLRFPDQPTPGTTTMTELLFRAFAYNINVRMADEGRDDVVGKVRTHEIGVAHGTYSPDIDLGVSASGLSPETAAPDMDPVVIRPTDDRGVTISVALVQHAPVFPALGYRFDTPNGSVAFSGDTGPCDNVVRLAAGADVLVHEVIDLEFLGRRVAKLPNRDAVISHLASSHTSPEDAARIAQRAGVRTLVLSHLVPGDDEFPEEYWESRARPFFDGEIVCGVDLDEFALGPTVDAGDGRRS